MSRAKDLARLQALAALIRDHRLGELQAAAEKRAQSQRQIAALDRPEAGADLPPVAGSLVAQRYQVWADRRRIELNTVLARQTADWLDAREAAGKAFGQAEALRALQERSARKG